MRDTLRLITCGSVDDGKSTLLGRLLYESQNIFEDQIQQLANDSRLYGTQQGHMDYALLLDGLQSERQQGITIDVSYRYFTTATRRYILADTPGHVQYTRNMATGASTADVAVVLVDARKGILSQTLRHSRIVAMMDCRHIVLAINKMDLVGFDQQIFARHVADFMRETQATIFDSVYPIPLCSLDGDNLVNVSQRTPWYQGKPLLGYLDSLDIKSNVLQRPFRMPVQMVNRPHMDFRGYCGRIAAGAVQVNMPIGVYPSGVTTKIKRIFRGFSEVAEARAGDGVTLTFWDEVDVSRGCILASPDHPLASAQDLEATLIWLHQEPLVVGRSYLIKVAAKEMGATVTHIDFVETFSSLPLGTEGNFAPKKAERVATGSLAINEIARVRLRVDMPLVFEPFKTSKVLGGFILIDKKNYGTMAAGMLERAKPSVKSRDIYGLTPTINQKSRAVAKHQTPRCLWFTGLSGAGKSTLANLLEQRLFAEGKHTYLLDGDNLRAGINGDLGFSEADRSENVRRVAEIARLMVDAGLIVLVSLIAPFRRDRQRARELFADNEFIEIYLKTPLALCEQRDQKGLYAKARQGIIKEFTGIHSPYECPQNPEIVLDTTDASPEACVDEILRKLSL